MTDLRYPTSRPEMDSNRVVLAEFPRPEAWTEDAACAEYAPDQWFATDKRGIAEVKKVCKSQCPVRDQCLQYALRTNEPEGIWGGLDPDERKRLRRNAKRKSKAAA